jgi:hypothetical protein
MSTRASASAIVFAATKPSSTYNMARTAPPIPCKIQKAGSASDCSRALALSSPSRRLFQACDACLQRPQQPQDPSVSPCQILCSGRWVRMNLLLKLFKYITVKCNDETRLIVLGNSPAFLCWTDAYVFRHSCLTLARANHLMCHTVIQTNSLMHAPSICMISNTSSPLKKPSSHQTARA